MSGAAPGANRCMEARGAGGKAFGWSSGQAACRSVARLNGSLVETQRAYLEELAET
jgi:hypothetical protein